MNQMPRFSIMSSNLSRQRTFTEYRCGFPLGRWNGSTPHHSFLPAFPGAKPYHAAYERGVKIIGATSHYVTNALDAGPIIEQDITHISHHQTVNDLITKGRDLEKMVLARAVRPHIQHKILVWKNRTIVFE